MTIHRFLALVLFQFVLATPVMGAGASLPLARNQESQVATRSPRFLLAPKSSKAAPTPVDVRRNAVLRRVVSLKLERPNVGQMLAAIERQTGLKFIYSLAIVRPDRPVTLRADSITVGAALMEILVDSGVDVVLSDGALVSLVKRENIEGGSIVGQVTDTATKRGVQGVEVILEGTHWRAATDTAGWYRLADVDAGTYTLMARRVGYKKQSRQVTVRAGVEDTVSLGLSPAAAVLDELVTTATGIQRRRDIGNAVTTIRADSVMQTAPIRSLTDLLDNRVPGLAVQYTSGVPGDPARLRMRGIRSIMQSNDPVLIIDGVRVYSDQSEARSGNLTNFGSATTKTCPPQTPGTTCTAGTRPLAGSLPAPSPLDQIDPNIIDKIEVFKGPSAATLYGADAANGVIVVTTKKGRAGPTQWNFSLGRSRTDQPGRWPVGYYRWGHIPQEGNAARFCPLTMLACVQDSLVQFQALNDPDLTMLGRGWLNQVSLTASGGNQAITYSITGSYNDETGNLVMPVFEAERLRARLGIEPADWMLRPLGYKTWSVTSAVQAHLESTATVTLSAGVTRSRQQRSTLEYQLKAAAGTYVDRVNGFYYSPPTLARIATDEPSLRSEYLRDFYQRTTASRTTFNTGLTVNWQPRRWLTARASAGLNVEQRDDETIQPGGLLTPADSGSLNIGNGRAIVSSLNAQAEFRKEIGAGFMFLVSAGSNYQTEAIGDIWGSGTSLAPGTSTLTGARVVSVGEARATTSVFGWYIEPRIQGRRLSLSAGLRLDGGSANGARVTQTGGAGNLLGLPKLNGSWVISEEPWFPFSSLFSSLRLRGAYGQSQVQPGATDRLRLYTLARFGGSPANDPFLKLTTVGNSDLLPQRVGEVEAGFDADFLDSRVTMEFTTYRQTTNDMHLRVDLPLSINGGGNVVQNIGNTCNTGMDLTFGITPVRSPALTWSGRVTYEHQTNTLVKLGRGVKLNKSLGYVEGYEIGGRWARPILGYADLNSNGVLERNEVKVGDSLVYMGRQSRVYATTFSTDVALFNGAIVLTGFFSYESGGTQVDQTARENWILSPALVDSSAPLREQAAVLVRDVTEYGLIQDISTFRFETFSINYRPPTRVARFFRARELVVGVRGKNLGMHSTYRGKDPDVSTWTPGGSISDGGQLPQPRTWQLSVNLQY